MKSLARAASYRVALEHTIWNHGLLLGTMAALTMVSYVFLTMTVRRDGKFLLTTPFVLYGVLRYLYLIPVLKVGEVPDKWLLQDRPWLITVLFWGTLSVGILYRGS